MSSQTYSGLEFFFMCVFVFILFMNSRLVKTRLKIYLKERRGYFIEGVLLCNVTVKITNGVIQNKTKKFK